MTTLELPIIRETVRPVTGPSPSLSYLREALWPRMRWARFFLLLVALKGGCYWMVSKALHPGDPASVTATYRIADTGDIGYYPVIAGLAAGNLGDRTLLERAGQGVASFPIASVLPHAVLFRLFGIPGLILADLILTLLYYVTLAVLLRVLGIAEAVAYCVSLLIVSGAWLIPLHFAPHLPVAFWDLRIPRPIVTDTFLAIDLALIVSLLNGATDCWRWFALGAAFAALIQGEIYLAMSVAMLIGGLMLYLGWREWRGERAWGRQLRNAIALGAGAVLVGLPFGFQRVYENKEAARRLGVFEMARDHLWLLPHALPYLTVAFVGAAACLAYLLAGRAELPPAERESRQRNIALLVIFAVASLLVLPVSGFGLGKGIQLYHFEDAVFRICSLCLLALGLFVFEAFTRRLAARAAQASVAGVVVVSLAAALLLGYSRAARQQHIRADFPEYAAVPEYRRSFTQLTEELSDPKYRSAAVLGTFDHQLYAWWVTFHGGYSFMPDPFFTTAGDDEIESRLVRMGHVLGLGEAQFSALLDRKYVNALWLGHCKYALSRAHAMRPLEEYTPAVRAQIAGTSILDAGSVIALPETDRRRIEAKYASAGTAATFAPRLDLVVLLADPSMTALEPSSAEFRETYRNAAFRVYVRTGTENSQITVNTESPCIDKTLSAL